MQRIATDANTLCRRLIVISCRRAGVILAAALMANSFAGAPVRAASPTATADLTLSIKNIPSDIARTQSPADPARR